MTTTREDYEDKENSPNFHNKAEAKEGRRSAGGGFSRLLNDVTNSIKLEHDEKICQKMAAEMAAEHKELIRKDVNEGQALAIQVAVEERRRLQKEIAARKDVEEKDSYLAKRVYDQEKHTVGLCERDESLAQEVHDAEVAAELQKLFIATKKRMEELEFADAKLAHQAQDELIKTDSILLAQQERVDRLVAQRVLEEEKDLQKHIWNEQIRQEEEDFKYSNKLLIATARAEHRRQKYVKMVVNRPCSAQINCSACNHPRPSAAELWRDADAVVEDVMGGICISLLLPSIERVTVKLVSSRVVAVEATRLVHPDEAMEKKPQHTLFCMDFEIDWVGSAIDLNMTQEDLGYEYSSDSGMLHVYVDRVHLESGKSGPHHFDTKQQGDAASPSSSFSPSSSPSSSSSSSTSREILGGVIRTVKTKLGSLSRKMFTRQSASSGSNTIGIGSPLGPTYGETKQGLGCEESK